MIYHPMHTCFWGHFQNPASISITNRVEKDLSAPVREEKHRFETHRFAKDLGQFMLQLQGVFLLVFHDPCVEACYCEHSKQKSYKYKEEARRAGLGFLPLVMDTSGRMHKTLVDVLETAIDSAATVRNIPFSVLKHYWFSALLFTLHNAQTRGMEVLKHKVLGRDREETFETSDLVVSRSSLVRA